VFIDELTPESEELRVKFNSLRGTTVNAFAHAEFLMKSYLLALSNDERFDDGGGYSHKIEKLVSNFCVSFEKNDFFPQIIRDDVNLLMGAFKKAIEDRNQFVHGLARLIVKERKIEMQRYLPAKNNEVNIVTNVYDLDTMEESVRIFEDICNSVILLVIKLDDTLELDLKRAD